MTQRPLRKFPSASWHLCLKGHSKSRLHQGRMPSGALVPVPRPVIVWDPPVHGTDVNLLYSVNWCQQLYLKIICINMETGVLLKDDMRVNHSSQGYRQVSITGSRPKIRFGLMSVEAQSSKESAKCHLFWNIGWSWKGWGSGAVGFRFKC